ncbi:peptidoglycan-binding protein [Duganella sp. FT92W]|uniref:Peptidoglycan-binding protein n=1 Tax=Pseudoduganella rivuli TaxID=2666085 RepID=A0A7X2IPX4_9BURK|nr:peptidoglycan-binding protein [Pseudoduganella rivuli]MRV73388.1 peptidoglycan-binding protein [Pseudoduganella rivuli]
MATQKTGFQKWQDGISKAARDAKWDSWDCEIRSAVNEFNRHLADTPGYTELDWRLVKAMVWTETGAEHREWARKPMQIGVAGDPGLAALLSGNEGGDLILPSTWKKRLTSGSARTIPNHNIRAGIGYLLMRMANFEYRHVADSEPEHGGRAFHRQRRSQRVIAGWRRFSTDTIAKRYNGGGDPNYASKLDFALEVMRGRVEAVCEQ